MSADIEYDITNSDGGSPFWASHKEFEWTARNLGKTRAEVEDDCDSSDWETPCIQNSMVGFARITSISDFDYFDVLVTLWGSAIESGTVTGTGRVTGGLAWHFSDHKANRLVNGRIDGAAPPATPKTVIVHEQYAMRMLKGRRTRICEASSAGGIQIAPNPGSYYVSTVVSLVMGFVVQPINGYFLGQDEPGSVASAGTTPGSFYKSSEQFYDLALRRQIGEMASSFGEKMDREVQVIVERESKYKGRKT